jgi:hypothetical protein
MGGAVAFSSHYIQQVLGAHRFGRVVDLAISIPLGTVVFYAACRALKVAELDLATRAIAGPLARRFRPASKPGV